MKKYYFLTEEELLALLNNSNSYIILKSVGVDNWEQYVDSFHDFIKDWIEEK